MTRQHNNEHNMGASAPCNAGGNTMPEENEINTMTKEPVWLARYNDGSFLLKVEDDGTVHSIKDIDESKLKIFEIWMKGEEIIKGVRHPLLYPVFAFRFHPEIARLICFYRTIREQTVGVDGPVVYLKILFGYQITVGAMKKKNFQFIWSIRGDTGQVSVEEKTGRENLSLNPGQTN